MNKKHISEQIIKYCLKMEKDGLTSGTGGNISVKNENRIYITPSGIDYSELIPEYISELDEDGNFLGIGKRPSSEREFHSKIYKTRPDVKSIVHTHSTYACVLGCLKKELPPVHYLVASAGKKVPVAGYAGFGTKELADEICSVISDSNAVFMANHGLVSVGKTLYQAYSTALYIEFVSKVYVISLSCGKPFELDENEIADAVERIDSYLGSKKNLWDK
ncbi:MAG: class II aldolase/adducin family protein [Desulfobacteraceae bacterium]|nr:class II aldolase/adducin family protein [Desulfobacteraceae bacterium]MCB9494478.1 class II aldolase/adducin family protein [Desulfobacteraceae bacterium]